MAGWKTVPKSTILRIRLETIEFPMLKLNHYQVKRKHVKRKGRVGPKLAESCGLESVVLTCPRARYQLH